jgi:hypothetical protein
MGYTLGEVFEKTNTLADKVGSDFFTRPVLMHYFENATYDFVGERLKVYEKNQEITDDISNLIIPKYIPMILSPDIGFDREYVAAIPDDYMRLLSYGVVFQDESTSRRCRLMKNAQYMAMRNDPNNEPDPFYPIIVQQFSTWKIYVGSSLTPFQFRIVYCKKPTFAPLENDETRIVNLSDEAIEKIILSSITKMFNSTADTRIQSSYQIQEAFRKVFS